MLFPIQWNEPFGLVMIEAMACGTPVLALPGGSVEEVVRDGVSGFVCNSIEEMAERAKQSLSKIKPETVHSYACQHFSVERMVNDYIDLYQEMIGGASPLGTARSVLQREDSARAVVNLASLWLRMRNRNEHVPHYY